MTTSAKKPNNLDNILAKASKTTTDTKALKGDYKVVPGFKDYEYNSSKVLRSLKSGKVQMIPTGKKKYLIYDSNGKRKPIGTEELDALCFPKKQKAKAQGKKNYTPQDVDTKKLLSNLAIKTIVNGGDKKHYKMFLLSKKDLTNKEIAALLETNTGHVYNELKRYKENPERANA